MVQKVADGEIVRAIKQNEAIREKNLVLVRKKPSIDTYVNILKAVKVGACYPSAIVLASGVHWITVMQCMRKLEQKGLIETGFDQKSGRTMSRLTQLGNDLLSEKN